MRRITPFVFAAFLASVMVAIAVQDLGGVVPEGLFNTGRAAALFASVVSFIACAVGLIIVLLDINRGRTSAAGRLVRLVVSFVVVLEVLITVTDLVAMSRSPSAPLGGPYYEMHGESGERLILRKRGGVPPFGFRADEPYAETSEAFRVLFLGDSYTEGSGRQAECNYPTVVERVLATQLGRPVEVMNAGVSGYGPAQALTLLGELDARGYEYDAVVFNVFIENDFTDNLPGSERRVVAGMAFRFPESWFLRTFHPVNTRTFRTAMFLRGLIRVRYELGDVAAIPDEPCDLTPQRLKTLPETVGDIVTRKLADVAHAAASPRLQRGAIEPIRAMAKTAHARGVPFAVVVFPDRASADPDVARLLELDDSELTPSRHLRDVINDAVVDTPVFDVGAALDGRPGMYRGVDTHLSDLGNVVAGEWVAKQLGPMLAGE